MDVGCFGEANNGKVTGSYSHSEVAEVLMDAVRADRVVLVGEDSWERIKVSAHWAGPGEFSATLRRVWSAESWSEASLDDVVTDLHENATALGKAIMDRTDGVEAENNG